MNDELKKAAEMLKTNGYTCVAVKKDIIYTSYERGVRPLLKWYDEGTDLSDASVADKVVGKAAAMMYVLMRVKEVYSFTMSKAAVETFEDFGVEWYCDSVAEVINNRTKTGSCPMELAVLHCEEPEASYKAIKEKLAELSDI